MEHSFIDDLDCGLGSKFYIKGSSIKHFLINAKSIKSIPESLEKFLSDKSGNYCLIDKNSVVYVGESDKPDGGVITRVKDHFKSKVFDSVLITVSSDSDFSLSEIRMNIEDGMINRFHPILNKAKGCPSRISEESMKVLNRVLDEIKSVLALLRVFPREVKEESSKELWTSPETKKTKKKPRGLITDRNLKSGDELVFVNDTKIRAKIVNDSVISVLNPTGAEIYRGSLSQFVVKWRVWTGRRKPGDRNNTADGPKYWRTVDGKLVSSL